jgi:ABC-type phosphate transport system substrate-binding protein
MFKTTMWTLLLALATAAGGLNASGGVVVIGHAGLMPSTFDAPKIARIYMGKDREVDGVAITAVNAAKDSSIRNRFLKQYFNHDEDWYTGYWQVRRYSGLGAPPPDKSAGADIVNFVNSTPGAIGYIDEADVQPGMNVLLK